MSATNVKTFTKIFYIMVFNFCNCFLNKQDNWLQQNVLNENEEEEHLLQEPIVKQIEPEHVKLIEPGCEELFKAIRSDDVDKAVSILTCNKKLTNFEYEQSTPLIEAIKCKNISIINLLITNGSNVEQCDSKNGEPPLFIAIASDDSNVLDAILGTTVDVNRAHGSLQVTALHYCVTKHNLKAVSKLVGTPNIDLNKQDKYGNTALHDAVDQDLHSIVFAIATAFVYRYIDYDIKNNNGFTAVEINSGKSIASREILKRCIEIRKKVQTPEDQLSAINEIGIDFKDLPPILVQPNVTMYVVSDKVQISNRNASHECFKSCKLSKYDELEHSSKDYSNVCTNKVCDNIDVLSSMTVSWENSANYFDGISKKRSDFDVQLLDLYRKERINKEKWWRFEI